MVILENIDIDIDIDKGILQNIDIDKISNRFKFGISNRANRGRLHNLTTNSYKSIFSWKICFLSGVAKSNTVKVLSWEDIELWWGSESKWPKEEEPRVGCDQLNSSLKHKSENVSFVKNLEVSNRRPAQGLNRSMNPIPNDKICMNINDLLTLLLISE